MKRDSFVFYRSFYEAIKKLNKKDFEINALCDYSIKMIEKEIIYGYILSVRRFTNINNFF